MQKFIVDVGALLSGRTIEVQANSAKEALEIAKKQLDRNRFEQIIQVRDSINLFYYTHEHNPYDWR